MKTQPGSEMTAIPKNLHKLVSLAAGNSMPSAVQRHTFIVNEVPRDFQIVTDEKLLSAVINELLSTLVSLTKHSCIRIKASEYEDMMFVSVRDNSSYSNYDVSSKFEEVERLAKRMNGNVSIRNKENTFTSILFSFPNFPKAA